MTDNTAQPSPDLFFSALWGYIQSSVLLGAVKLDIFTRIAEGNTTVEALAEKCQASERGIRILCDYLTTLGFTTKTGNQYGLTQDSAIFLDRNSPACLAGIVTFMLHPDHMLHFQDMAQTVRKGGTITSEEGNLSPENPVWVEFARAMPAMMSMPAQMMAEIVSVDPDRKIKILDIAAGHGIFGINFAKKNPNVEVIAVDWAPVLEVAKENAQKFGVADRHSTIAGSAFDVDFGEGFDLVLLTNFLHHFDVPTCESLLRKVHACLNDDGRVLTLELVPNEDRISPIQAAQFAMMMLASTSSGDAYTFAELDKMFLNSGFARSELQPLPPTPQSLVISYKS